MAKMGRPKIHIDQQLFESLCKIQCTKDEIAGVLNVSDSTLSRWAKSVYSLTFEDIYKKFSSEGKSSLRRHLIQRAFKNDTVLIFVAKDYLGMTDHRTYEAKINADVNTKIEAKSIFDELVNVTKEYENKNKGKDIS